MPIGGLAGREAEHSLKSRSCLVIDKRESKKMERETSVIVAPGLSHGGELGGEGDS